MNIIRRTLEHRGYVIRQIIMTILAFIIMVFLSHSFTNSILLRHLEGSTAFMLDYGQYRIEDIFQNSRNILDTVSLVVELMLESGYAPEAIVNFIEHMSLNILTHNLAVTTDTGVFGYLYFPDGTSMFIGADIEDLEGISPTQRPWYLYSYRHYYTYSVLETPPFWSVVNEKFVISFFRNIMDSHGQRIGVLSFAMPTEDISVFVADRIGPTDGHGILLDEDFVVIAHPNQNLINVNLWETDFESVLVLDYMERYGLHGTWVNDYRGVPSVVFTRRLDNNWLLAVMMEREPLYRDINNMVIILSIIGTALGGFLIFALIRIDNSRIAADAKSQHKSTFLANMSHEIRTPIHAIIGMTDIGKSASNTERKDYCFGRIEVATQHLLGIIEDILDMSKIEANKLEFSYVEFNFESMLQQVVNVMTFKIEEKEQSFTIHIDNNIPATLVSDDQRIAQVFTNLLSNAIKFTPHNGQIRASVNLVDTDDEGFCTICFEVKDNGIGISPKNQTSLFDAFHQANNDTTRRFGGTGLGLAISKRIVEMAGGKIWIESVLGKGSTFFFTIKAKPGKAKAAPLLEGVEISSLRVMVVDDEQDIRTYFHEFMAEAGIYCDTCAGGAEALAKVRNTKGYHIYFIDWKMPEMDGLTLAYELKNSSNVPPVVIMVSSAALTEVQLAAKGKGIDMFLTKPLFPSAIMNAINTVLGSEPSGPKDEEEDDFSGFFAGHTVLLAEDAPVNREIALVYLEPTGMKIECAENGRQAVEMFAAEPQRYDLILMDLQMPEMDGYEATHQIRALDITQAKTIPILAMTANVFKEDIERCYEAGMNDHLGKPLNYNLLVDKLCIYLQKEKSISRL